MEVKRYNCKHSNRRDMGVLMGIDGRRAAGGTDRASMMLELHFALCR